MPDPVARCQPLFALGAGLLLLLAALVPSPFARADSHLPAGEALFYRYCSACHGTLGTGDGPVAPYLRVQPADLTRLHERYGSPLDRLAVAAYIDGRRDVDAHGPREMPVWGEELHPEEVGPEGRRKRRETVLKIVDFLQTIQGSRTSGASEVRPDAASE